MKVNLNQIRNFEKITDLRKVKITIHMLLIKDKIIIQNFSNDVVDFVIKQRMQCIPILRDNIWSLLISCFSIKIHYVIILCPLLFTKRCTILFTIFRTRSTFLENLIKRKIVLIMNLYKKSKVSKFTLTMIKTIKKTNQEVWYLNTLASLKLLFIHGVFMHNPITPRATRSSASIENQGFLHSNCPRIAYHITIPSCCLPVSMSGGSI